jgi:hypothetical protein
MYNNKYREMVRAANQNNFTIDRALATCFGLNTIYRFDRPRLKYIEEKVTTNGRLNTIKIWALHAGTLYIYLAETVICWCLWFKDDVLKSVT